MPLFSATVIAQTAGGGQSTQLGGGVQFDWTINLGAILTIAGGMLTTLLFIVGLVIVFVRLQDQVREIDRELKTFRLGLDEFQADFKVLGAQVVHALVAIARLEATNGKAPESSLEFNPQAFRRPRKKR